MQMSDKRESRLNIVEPTETPTSAARSDGSRRADDEEREIARLYAETSTPTSEIPECFRIGDSSLYRVVQRRGVALRGRIAPQHRKTFRGGSATLAWGGLIA